MRLREILLSFISWLSLVIISLSVCSLVIFLFMKGADSLDSKLLFGNVSALDAIFGLKPVWYGIWPSVAGSLLLLLVTMIIAIIPGIFCGVYLACFASVREKNYISLCVDILAGIPSIVMGLFGLELIIVLRRTFLPHGTTCLLLAAICLAILILPVLITSVRSSIEALPSRLMLTAVSLGMSRNQTVRNILIPCAMPGIIGGVILSMSRAMEDTAVIMLTGAVANAGLPGLFSKFEALPFRIYYTSAQYTSQEELAQGFGTALLLLLCSWALIMTAKIFQARLMRKWEGVKS
ncbi:MAG: ABC transporter permease subunit [Synergistaceae bacterium]|nr:ABC transporter permease subunit [Synergistaceae bacterium]